MFDIELLIKFIQYLVDELLVVVGDDHMGNPEMEHNTFYIKC